MLLPYHIYATFKALRSGASEPASRRPAPEHPLDNGPSAHGTTGEEAAQSSRQLGPSEGRLAYATVVAGSASLHLPSGTQKSSLSSSAQVVTATAPAAERQNRTPIYVTGVTDTRSFLAWLRALCPSGLSAQIKGERLMLVPVTADGFRATVTALRSLDGSKGVSFHTFSLPEDRCVRLLVRNLGRHMPEDAVREELESLGIRVQ